VHPTPTLTLRRLGASPPKARAPSSPLSTPSRLQPPGPQEQHLVNLGEIAGNKIDDDKNGYVDDVNGWDFYNNDATVYDSGDGDKHGTHVAGTIAAEGNNGIVTGVNWKAKIAPLKFWARTAATPRCYRSAQLCGSQGVKISNNSWGGRVSQHPARRDKTTLQDSSSPQPAAARTSTPKTRLPTPPATTAPTSSRWPPRTARTPWQTSRTTAPPRWTSRLRAYPEPCPATPMAATSGTSMATPHAAGLHSSRGQESLCG